jgi:hypothetical protein
LAQVRRQLSFKISGTADMGTEPTNEPPSIQLAASLSDQAIAANAQARLRLILATLEQCRASLINEAEHDTADLLSVTMLQLRMRLKGVTDSELKLLSDTQAEQAQAQPAHNREAPRDRRRRSFLELVK